MFERAAVDGFLEQSDAYPVYRQAVFPIFPGVLILREIQRNKNILLPH